MKTDLLVRKLQQFRMLSESDRFAVEEAAGKIVDHPAKHDVIRQGDRPDHVHLLIEGWACRYKLTPEGDRQIMAFLIPGDLCDVQVTLLDRMDHSISTLSACRILAFPRQRLGELTEHRGQLSQALWWSTMVDEAILREWLVNIGGRSSDKRVAHLICEMQHRTKAVGLSDGNGFEMPVTQDELADAMGMTPVHMNRSFQALRTRGLIFTEGRRVGTANLKRLMEFSDFNPIYLHQGHSS